MVLTVRKALDCAGARLVLLSGLLLWGVQPALGQSKAQTPQQANARILTLAQISPARPQEIPVGTGDLLQVDVFDVPDLSREVRVSDQGLISLPLLPQQVAVAGCSTFEAGQKIGELLQANGLVSHPQVSVLVKQQNSQPISVVGAVGHPMVYEEIRPTTLLEVLAQADGIAADAGDSIIITRQSAPRDECGKKMTTASDVPAAKSSTIVIQLSKLLQSGDPQYNVPVFGGDVITVPRAGVVYVAGAVEQPGGYKLHDPGESIDTIKAVALAHGLLSSAKPNDAVILRKDPATGQTKEIRVKFKKIQQRKVPDISLYANDVLYFPDSTSKRILGRAAAAALGVTSGVAIIRGSQ